MINFNAGDHAVSVSIGYADYLQVENPEVGRYGQDTACPGRPTIARRRAHHREPIPQFREPGNNSCPLTGINRTRGGSYTYVAWPPAIFRELFAAPIRLKWKRAGLRADIRVVPAKATTTEECVRNVFLVE